MRRSLALAAIVPTALLASCAGMTTHMVIGKSLTGVLDVAYGAAGAAESAYSTGLLSKADHHVVTGWVDKIDDVQMTARCFYTAGNDAGVAEALNMIGALTLAINAQVAHKPIPAIPAFQTFTCSAPAPAAAVKTGA